MKIRFLLFILLLNIYSNLYAKNGQGEFKFTNYTFEGFIKYLAGDGDPKEAASWNKFGRPLIFVASKSGKYVFSYYCPQKWVAQTRCPPVGTLIGDALRECKKIAKKRNSDERCYVFAKNRKIVWNSVNYTIEKNMNRDDVKNKLIELGFFKGKIINSQSNIADQLKNLKYLYDNKVLSKEEYEKAKNKLIN